LHDVVIVGAGPVGSYTACQLASMGHDVLVLERRPTIGEKTCCTGIIGQECARTFAIRDVILKVVNSARLFSPSGKLTRIQREEPQAAILDRTALDRAMAHKAQDKGAEYILEAPVSKITIEEDRVRVEESGQGRSFAARAVIIASGFGSKLTGQLGLGSINDSVAGTQAEVETAGNDEVEIYLGNEIAPGFFAWLVPTSPQRARVGLLSRHSPEAHLRKLLASLAADGKIVSAEVKPSYGAIPLKTLPRTSGERLMVLGDAAGQVKPTTGGGIYYGLLCADIAAEAMHPALKDDDLSARRMAGYEKKWRRKLSRELKIGYQTRKIFESLTDRQIERIFALEKKHGIVNELLKSSDLSFDWHSKAVFGLISHRIIARAINVMRLPFRNDMD